MSKELQLALIVAAGCLAPGLAGAQEVLARPDDVGPGIGVLVGGGVSTLTREAGQEVAEPGADWVVRGIFGTRAIIAGELAYVGTGRGIAPDLGDGLYLVRNGGEPLVRAQLPIGLGADNDGLIEPFAVGGLNLSAYTLATGDLDVEGIGDDDLAFSVPFGGGLMFGYQDFLGELRATYAPVLNGNLVPTDRAALSALTLTASVGVEF